MPAVPRLSLLLLLSLLLAGLARADEKLLPRRQSSLRADDNCTSLFLTWDL